MADEIDDTEYEPVDVAEPLPFSDLKQQAVLGYLLQDESFFLQSWSKIKETWFSDPLCANIWKARIAYQRHWRMCPKSINDFIGSPFFQTYDNALRNKLEKVIKLAINASREFNLTALRGEMTLWLQSRLFKTWLERASGNYNAAQFDPPKMAQAFTDIFSCARQMRESTFESTSEVLFNDLKDGSFDAKREANIQTALTFGCPPIDKFLLSGCVNGGLLRGDNTIILAPTNQGKSSCLITVARHNIYRKKSVLYVTHEDHPDNIKDKVYRAMLGRTREERMAMAGDPLGVRQLLACERFLRQYLTYLPMNKPGLTVEEVYDQIKVTNDKRKAETGAGYDLIIDDYPAKLTTERASKGQMQKRHIDEVIYGYFTQMALEFDAHMLTAIQTNREGAKTNKHRGGGGRRLLSMEDVQESYGAMQTASNVISLNRDDLAEQNNRLTYHLCKTRANNGNWSVVTRTRYDLCVLHSPDFDTCYYRGTATLDDKIDMLLEQCKGGSVPVQYYNL
jgi:hypothetical protein